MFISRTVPSGDKFRGRLSQLVRYRARISGHSFLRVGMFRADLRWQNSFTEASSSTELPRGLSGSLAKVMFRGEKCLRGSLVSAFYM